jgi:mercuric ion transport protein
MTGKTCRQAFLALPGISFSILPKVGCPLCWAAQAGLLGSLGFGFLASRGCLLPLTAGFLILAVATLGYRAQQRRGSGPLLLGSAASALILIAKFILEANLTMYAGTMLLLIASLWNQWPRSSHRRACHEQGGADLALQRPADKKAQVATTAG